MRVLRPSSEDEMIAVFLRGELPSERWAPVIERALANAGADRLLVEDPDLSDPDANDVRRRVLTDTHGYGGEGLFNGFPRDVRWEWVGLTPEELIAVRYIDYSYWEELFGGTRLPRDGARRIREGVEPFGVPSAGFFELAAELEAGARFSALILVDGREGLVVLEGHARLTSVVLMTSVGSSERQFSLLREIGSLLAAARIPFWLRGGWALDFLLGTIRPDHADVDLVALRDHRDALYEVLTSAGFTWERELPDAAIDFVKDDQSIQFALVEVTESGAVVTRGFEEWPWPAGTLDGPWRELRGVRCRTLSLHALLEEKENYGRFRGRPLRAKDRASIEALRRLMGDALS